MSECGVQIMAENGATVLVMKIMVIVVAVLMIATVALPAVQYAQSDIYTTENNSGNNYAVASGNTNLAVALDAANEVWISGFKINTSTMDVVMFSDTFLVRHFKTLNPDTIYVDSLTDKANYGTTAITVTGTQISFTDANNTQRTLTYTGELMYAAPEGDYGYFVNGSTFKINEDSKLYMCAADNATNSDLSPSSVGYITVMSGTMGEFASDWAFSTTSGVTSVSVSASLSGITDLGDRSYSVELSSATTTVTTNLGDYTNTALVGVFAPLEYKYVGDADGSMISLIGIIPIMLILVPVMMAVRMMALKRN